MNIYTHSNRRAKRTSVEILDDLSTSIPSEIRKLQGKVILNKWPFFIISGLFHLNFIFYDKPEFIENNQYNYIFFLRLIHKTKAG